MKNDIKQIKNEISNTQTQKQAKEQKKVHQEALKDNLMDIFIEFLECKGKSLLYLLENKHKIIIKAIERTKSNEIEANDFDESYLKYKKRYYPKNWTSSKEKNKDEQDVEDYNFLYDVFFSIYSKIEREENKKNKLRKEENEKKLHKIITNKIEYNLEIANKKSNIAKKYIILTYKYVELKDAIIKEIKEDFKEYSNEEIAKMYDIVLKELLNKYKYTNEQEPTQQEPVKLHWVWKANFALDAINKLFKHF